MRKVNFSKKEKMITICGIITLIIILIIGFNYYQKREKQKKIDTYITELQTTEKAFSVVEKREDKINVLKSLLKEREKYEQSDNSIDEVSKEYTATISSMQEYFKERYNKTLQDNKLGKIDKISDKKILNNNKANLIILLNNIQNEKEIILTKGEFKKYEDNINGLIKAYDTRLVSIEEKDKNEEKEHKSKEEVKKKADKEPSTRQNYNINNSSNNGANGNSSSNRNNSYPSNKKNQKFNSGKSNKVNGNSFSKRSSSNSKYSNGVHSHFSDGKGYESWNENGKYHDNKGNTWTQKDIDDDNF